MPQIARCCRRIEYALDWVNRPCVQKTQKNPENNIFSCLKLIYLFARTSASCEDITTLTLYRPPIRSAGEISEFLVHISCLLQSHSTVCFGRDMCLVFK